MKKIHYILFLFYLLYATGSVYSQVTIGTVDNPHRDAVLDLKSEGNNKGLLLPRLNLVDVNEPEPMKRHIAGMVVYNKGENNVPAGYYYNDGYQWVQIFDSQVSAWRNVQTQEAAKSNTDDIYQNAVVVTGASEVDPKTQFAAVSTTKGALFPRLTQTQIDAMREAEPVNEIPDGLFVYNLSSKCFNYFEQDLDRWVSLCADEEPAVFELADCSQANYYPQTQGAYVQGTQLTDNHYYKLQVRVTKKGKYSIRLNTANNYSFEKSGTFTEVGIYDIILQGQGIPLYPSLGDAPILLLNGKNVTADLPCELPKIPVASAHVVYEVQCNSGSAGTVNGVYTVNVSAEDRANNYIDITVTVSASGNTNIVTNEVNGMVFRSDAVYLDQLLPSQTVRLYAYGTPQNAGTIQFTPSGAPCSFDVTVINPLGTFRNPAKNCLAILNDNPSNTDGMYWIRQGASNDNPVKTYCDMTNGGYTLVWSYSEATSRNIYKPTGNMSTRNETKYLRANFPRNQIITDVPDPIKFEDFRLSNSAMLNVCESNTPTYKVKIVYNPSDMNDAWGNENYFIANPVSSAYSFLHSTNNTYTWNANVRVTGKILNVSYSHQSGNTIVFNGKSRSSDISAVYYGSSGYGNHWDISGRLSRIESGSITSEITKYDGTKQSIQWSPSGLNNAFGYHAETEMNHHWGKCYQGGDDYIFDRATCGSGDLYPHSFNNGQGRYLQWWVK